VNCYVLEIFVFFEILLLVMYGSRKYPNSPTTEGIGNPEGARKGEVKEPGNSRAEEG